MSLSIIHAGSRPDFLEPLPLFFTPLPPADELPPTLPYTEYECYIFAQEEEEADPWADDTIFAGQTAPSYNTECFCEHCGYELQEEDDTFCDSCLTEMWRCRRESERSRK